MIDIVGYSLLLVYASEADLVQLDEQIDNGILYYSATNSVLRVTAARNEIRGLIIARNEIVTYLHRRMTLSTNSQPTPSIATLPTQVGDHSKADRSCEPPIVDIEDQVLLPAAIDNARTCKRCFMIDSCMLYRKVRVSIQSLAFH